MKKHFWKLEYSITLLVIFGIIFMLIPVHFTNYSQAYFIQKWKEKYEEITYMFSVIDAQQNDDLLKSIKNAQTQDQKELLIQQIIKPYLRLKSVDSKAKRYKPKYMNDAKIKKDSIYYFEDLYYSDNEIIGLKDVESNTKNAPWFVMMVDVNGLLPPNIWGKDIFGIYVYNENTISPFGHDKDINTLKSNCTNSGYGTYCSYFYMIGGEFND